MDMPDYRSVRWSHLIGERNARMRIASLVLLLAAVTAGGLASLLAAVEGGLIARSFGWLVFVLGISAAYLLPVGFLMLNRAASRVNARLNPGGPPKSSPPLLRKSSFRAWCEARELTLESVEMAWTAK